MLQKQTVLGNIDITLIMEQQMGSEVYSLTFILIINLIDHTKSPWQAHNTLPVPRRGSIHVGTQKWVTLTPQCGLTLIKYRNHAFWTVSRWWDGCGPVLYPPRLFHVESMEWGVDCRNSRWIAWNGGWIPYFSWMDFILFPDGFHTFSRWIPWDWGWVPWNEMDSILF